MNCGSSTDSTAIIAIVVAIVSGIFTLLISIRQSANQKEIEQIRSGFKWDEIRLAKLREEQGVIFKELYAKLVLMFKAAKETAIRPDEPLDQKRIKVDSYKKATEDFIETYQKQKIWLNDPLCELIDKLRTAMEKALRELRVSLDVESLNNSRTTDAAHAALASLDGEVAKIKKEIEAKFRELMHV